MSMSLSLTRLMRWPNSVTSSSAVSWSMVWVSVTGDAHLEQRFDEVGAALGHAIGEFLHRDRFGHDHVADLLGRGAGLHVVALFLLAGAAKRGERAGAAVVLVGQSAGDGQLAAMALIVAAAAARASRLRAARRRGMAAAGRRTPCDPPAALALREPAARALRRLRLRCGFLVGLLASLLSGGFFGLAIVFGAAALFLALLGAGAVLAAARFLEAAQARLPRPRAAACACISLRRGNLFARRAAGAAAGQLASAPASALRRRQLRASAPRAAALRRGGRGCGAS